jgi:cell division transport system permease protein
MTVLDWLEFMLTEAVVSLRRNPLMTFAAVSTTAVALFLMGGLGYLYVTIENYASTIPGKFEMRVFLKDSYRGEAAVAPIADKLRKIPDVSQVTWIPRDKNWELYKQKNPDLAAEVLDNPIPESFKVRVTDLARSDAVANTIRAMPEIATDGGISYLKDEETFIERLLSFIRWLGGVFGGLLFVTGGILIYNAIRLAVLSRRIEIRIMRLVGASSATIRVPFLIEGVVQGTVGGALAAMAVFGANDFIYAFIRQNEPSTSFPAFPLEQIVLLLSGIGAVYGLLCSMIAVRTPLRGQ